MNTLTRTSPETAATLRGLASAKLRRALGSFISTFEATPDDKLDFKLSETTNSPRELMIHVISGNSYVGASLGIELSGECEATDRASLIAKLTETTEALITRIESLTPEEFDTTVSFFGNEIPMAGFVFIDEWHLSRHAGQIDYLQTTWGDLEDH